MERLGGEDAPGRKFLNQHRTPNTAESMNYPKAYHAACAALVRSTDHATTRAAVTAGVRALRKARFTRAQVRHELRHFAFINPAFLKA